MILLQDPETMDQPEGFTVITVSTQRELCCQYGRNYDAPETSTMLSCRDLRRSSVS